MLTGTALGKALAEAIRLKGVSKAAVARHFGIKGPSIYDWINHGRIGKQHLTELVAYFSDVVGPEHWGMPGVEASQPARLDISRLTGLIETVDTAALEVQERRGFTTPARLKARLIVQLYEDSGSKSHTARAVANALAKLLRSEELQGHGSISKG